MPRAICTKKDCIYYSELEVDKCELDLIRITLDGECSDKEEEFRELK